MYWLQTIVKLLQKPLDHLQKMLQTVKQTVTDFCNRLYKM